MKRKFYLSALRQMKDGRTDSINNLSRVMKDLSDKALAKLIARVKDHIHALAIE